MEIAICPFCLHAETLSYCSIPFAFPSNITINHCWNCDKEFIVLELSKLEELLKARKQ